MLKSSPLLMGIGLGALALMAYGLVRSVLALFA